MTADPRATSTAYFTFQCVIPEPHDRLAMTWSALPLILYALLGLLLLACLARKPNTRLLRMLVLPTVILSAFRFSFRYVWTEPILNVYNWGQRMSIPPVLLRPFISMALCRPLGTNHRCKRTRFWPVQRRQTKTGRSKAWRGERFFNCQ